MPLDPQMLVQMSAFAAVVEAEGFTAAAGRKGLSKAALSRHVSELEDRLGVRLLNRTTRRLSLTEAGRSFYEGCQRMLAEAENAEALVTALASRPTGTLRLAAPMSFGVSHLSPMLAAFLEQCPDLGLDLVLGDRAVNLVEEGFDAAFRIGKLADSSLIALKLFAVQRLVLASPAYLKRAGVPLQPQDLMQHRCLHYSYFRDGQSWRFTDGKREAAVTPGGPIAVNNGDALLAMAKAGHGIVCLPSFFAIGALQEGSLLRLLPGWEDGDPIAAYLVYPARRNAPPKVRALADFLRKGFRDPPPWDAGIPEGIRALPPQA